MTTTQIEIISVLKRGGFITTTGRRNFCALLDTNGVVVRHIQRASVNKLAKMNKIIPSVSSWRLKGRVK